MATIEGRGPIAYNTVKVISPQVDFMHVTFNLYEEVPQWVGEFKNVIPSVDPENRFRDVAKLLNTIDYDEAYYFCTDDDFHWPEDYVDTLIPWFERFHDRVILTIHSSNSKGGNMKIANRDVPEPVMWQTPGSGTCSFNTKYVNFKKSEISRPYSWGDFVVFHKALSLGIPTLTVPRKAGWMRIRGHPCLNTRPCLTTLRMTDDAVAEGREWWKDRCEELRHKIPDEFRN